MKRFLPLLLCFALALPLLTGCGKGEQSATTLLNPRPSQSVPESQSQPPEPTAPPATMPQQELAWALDYLEYTGVAAILELDGSTRALQAAPRFSPDQTVFIADLDGDGLPELAFGHTLGMMDRGNSREYLHEFAQSGFTYFEDKNGIIYRCSGVGAGSWSFDWDDPGMPGPGWNPPLPESGNPADWYCYYADYDTFYPGNAHHFSYDWEVLHELVQDGENYRALEEPYYADYTLTTQDGTVYKNDEANQRLDSLALQEIQTTARDCLTADYSDAYAQSLLDAVDARFSSDYSGYQGARQADVDADGEMETLFVVSHYLEPWRNNVHTPTRDYPVEMEHTTLNLNGDYTVLLIADQAGGKIQFQALAAGGLHSHGDVSVSSRYLTVGSGIYLLPGSGSSGADSESCQALSRYLAQFGYTDSYFLLADLCDEPGQEMVAYCHKDGVWYVVIIVIRQGAPEILSVENATDKAFYLIEDGGKTYLMSYAQGINTWNSTPYYSYQAYRFTAKGGMDYLGNGHVTVAHDGSNAYETAQFQQKFQGLLVKVIVIYDPFAITGSRYPAGAQVAFGEIAQEQETGKVGYVQLNDPSTWLHLREGPGTQYPRVLIDPSDPESFIRQAHGSAVTILETIETGDPENPVWVKIRIRYAGQDIIGYSSKTFIRIPGE